MVKLMVCTIIIHFFGLVSSVPPAINSRHEYPEAWRDIWVDASGNNLKEVSITAQTFGEAFQEEITGMMSSPQSVTIVTTRRFKTCRRCRVIYPLHPNVLAHQSSSCSRAAINTEVLCKEAKRQNKKYLYRSFPAGEPTNSVCPAMFTSWGATYDITYSEYQTDTGSYVNNCGQSRTQLNSCSRKQPDDPEMTLSLGRCPESVLVHRNVLNQMVKCLGSWTDAQTGLEFIITRGSEYEYWDESGYKNKDDVYRCWAIQSLDNGRLIKMSQGFGSDCRGLGSAMTPENGFRNMLLSKMNRNVGQCSFPDWVAANQQSWKIIPRTGLIPSGDSPKPRQVFFPDLSSFILGSESAQQGQTFRCAAVVNSTASEVFVKTFTKSQCYGEYHCFHAKLSPSDDANPLGLVDLHVGAPCDNEEIACVKPYLDIDVPYLLATLVPIHTQPSLASSNPQTKAEIEHNNPANIPVNQLETTTVYDNEEKEANLKKIGKHALALLKQYQGEFSTKLEQLVNGIVKQVKYLCVDNL